jgi:hypothetical protein
MSDREVIIQLLRNVEWRLRANRLLHETASGLTAILLFLVAIKVFNFWIPLPSWAFSSVLAVSAIVFAVYVFVRSRNKAALEATAVSLDLKAGLNDEIKTALWFIKNPRSSEWVDWQIRRAAHKAAKIDAYRTFPTILPRSAYMAAAVAMVLVGLNLIALPGASPAAPESARSRNASLADSLLLQEINAGLDEIASELRKSERLAPVADALTDRRLADAANEFRKVGAELSGESAQALEDIQASMEAAAARNTREALQPLAAGLAEAAKALMNKDTASAQEGIEDIAQDLEDLDEEIYKQESPRDQLAAGNERRGEQDGHVPGAPIPDQRDFAQETSSSDGLGASGGNAEPGPRRGAPTTLDVKLEQEAMQGLPDAGISRIEVEEASRRERSKLDYRESPSDLTAAQKDALIHDSLPWKYRPIIKNYFQTIQEPAQNK